MKKTLFILSSLLLLLSCNHDSLKFPKLAGQIREYKGKPTLFINDNPVDPTIYALTTCPGGRFSWDEMPTYSEKRFAEIGINLYQGELFMRDLFPKDDFTLDLDLARKQVRGFIEANPNAAVFIRLRCNSSPVWNRQNKDQCMVWADTASVDTEQDGLHRWDDGDVDNTLRYSPASKKWRDDMAKKIEILCRELSRTPEGNSLVGIQMATNIYGENHYWGFNTHEPDVSQPMQIHFREWLKEKYKANEELQKAWNNSSVTLESATVPGMKERYPSDLDGIFRRPEKERQMIDYSQCQHELVVDNILLFCKTAKENWPRPLITGAFYGYTLYCFGRHAAGGHLEMERMLTSPYIDYLSAPMTYLTSAKVMGGSGHSRGLSDECRMHGKIWLDEFDNGTSLHPKNMQEYLSDFTENFEEDKTLIRRNMASTYTKGGGRWFYDFGPRTIGGWWNDSVLLNDIGKMKKVFEKYAQKDYSHEADVLVVYDTKVFYHLAHNWSIDILSHTATEWATVDLFRSGITFDMCFLFDLQKMNLDKYKVVLFANTFLMTDEQRAFIKSKVADHGRTLIWNYMPGYTNGNQLNDQFVKELVQMDMEKVKLRNHPPVVILNSNTDVTYSVWNNNPPVFKITDKQVKSIAHFKTDEFTAIASKNMGNWTSIFCSLPLQNGAVMREIFKNAGCHIYNENGDVIHAGGGILVVHTKEGGPRSIKLRNGKVIETELFSNSTSIFDSETGAILLK